MIFRWNVQSLLLYLVFSQLKVHFVITSWPSFNSTIQLLGLFEDISNTSEVPELSAHSWAMFKSAVLLSQQYGIRIEGQLIESKSVATDGNIIDALGKTCRMVPTSNILGIVGPGLSREAHLIAPFAQAIGIPIISYGATDPELSDRNAYPAFYRTVPSDNAIAVAIVKLFHRFNWTSCIIIHQNDAFGSGGAHIINEAFFNNDLIVEELIVFDIATLSIRGDLKTYLINSATRVVLLWTQSVYTTLVIQDALQSGVLGPEFKWILSSTVPLDSFDEKFRDNLIGLFSIEPVTGGVVNAPINTTLLNEAYRLWQKYEPESFPRSAKVNSYGLFAFDATWTLIQSLQTFCSTIINSSLPCLSFVNSSFCFDRRFVHSGLLLNTISRTEFLGVSGPIKFSFNVTDRVNGSYYYAQNVQFSSNRLSFVPVLIYSDHSDWKTYKESNVIVWPGNSLVPSTDRAMLKGINLRIGVIESTPYTIVTKVIDEDGQTATKLTGFVPDLIELLQNQMEFIPNIQLAPANHTYEELIQTVANGAYDIMIGDVTVTSKRREIVGFSSPIFDNSLRILMRKPSDVSIDLLSFLKPFSRNLWLLVLGACIYAAILLCLMERQNNEALQNQSILSQFAMSLWYSYGNLVGYGVDFHVNTAAGRLLTVSLYVLSLILLATYTANLTSDLTILKTKNIISGIDELKNGKIPFNRIGIPVGTASVDFFVREISGGSRNYYRVTSEKQLYDSLFEGIIDLTLMDTGTAEYVTNNIYCNLSLVGEGFDESVFAIVFSKEWLYAKDLDVHILSLKESGELDNLKQKWFQKRICPQSSETPTAMKVESMGGLFLTFAVISILSMLLFAWSKRKFFSDRFFKLVCQTKPSGKKKGSTRRHSIKTHQSLQNN